MTRLAAKPANSLALPFPEVQKLGIRSDSSTRELVTKNSMDLESNKKEHEKAKSGGETPSTIPRESKNVEMSPSKNKFTEFGDLIKNKLQLLASPLKTNSGPYSPGDKRKGRRMSATSTTSTSSEKSLTPSIKLNDDLVENIDEDIKKAIPRRLIHSARPGRDSAMSMKRRRRKKRRVQSETVLQEKKKDKWADYASQFVDDIEIEHGVQPKDKWDRYVKKYMDGSTSLLQNAEKKVVVKINYSSDDSSDEKKKKQAPSLKPLPEEKTMSGDESDSEDENDVRARLLDNMEKPVPDKESKASKSTKSPTGAKSKSSVTESKGHKNKKYKNGPAVDFHEQIRKISHATPPTIDMSQLVIPDKHKDSSSKSASKEDINNAIEDILKEEEMVEQQGRLKSAKRRQPTANPSKFSARNTNKDSLKELEESILASHDKDKKRTPEKKDSGVDELLTELNLKV